LTGGFLLLLFYMGTITCLVKTKELYGSMAICCGPEIIKMFPFEVCKPDFVKVEKKHLSHEDLRDTISRLVSNGYHCKWTERDIFAFRVI